MTNRTPDRLYIRKSDKKDYDILLDKTSPFEGKDNKHVFMMALIMGFQKRRRIKLGEKFGFIRTEYLNDDDISIINAIAVTAKESLDVLIDKKEVFSIAEEYASGGIKLLKDDVTSEYGSYIKRLESELVEFFESLKLSEIRE